MNITHWKSKADLGRAAWCVKHEGSQRFFETKDAAQRYVAKTEKIYVAGSIGQGWEWTVGKLVSEYIVKNDQDYKAGLITFSRMGDRVRHAKQFVKIRIGTDDIKNLKVRDITSGNFKTYFIPQIAEGRAKKTVENIMGSMINLFEFACDRDCRDDNPAKGISLKGRVVGSSKYRAEKIQPNVIGKIVNSMDDQWKLLTFFAIATGMRQGEQRALIWGDIDWHNNRISVVKAYKHGEGNLGDPKTISSTREVDLAPELKSQLQELYMRSGRPSDDQPIFQNKGKPIFKQKFIRVLGDACKKAGVDPIRWHDLRHFCASNLLQAYPDDMWYVSTMLGHKSPTITTNIYGHWLKEEDNSDRLNKLSGRFAQFAN